MWAAYLAPKTLHPPHDAITGPPAHVRRAWIQIHAHSLTPPLHGAPSTVVQSIPVVLTCEHVGGLPSAKDAAPPTRCDHRSTRARAACMDSDSRTLPYTTPARRTVHCGPVHTDCAHVQACGWLTWLPATPFALHSHCSSLCALDIPRRWSESDRSRAWRE